MIAALVVLGSLLVYLAAVCWPIVVSGWGVGVLISRAFRAAERAGDRIFK